uniref:23S rRNA (adenine(2030)-N(6))-methyltransferase RlmJ n=1 Tax=Yoonia sp. TaxID=2212373 RepID=UPI0040486115
MLSYQHGFHAGNLADVHKHALLAWMLDYLTRKDKPLSYLETHAGRALYDLSSDAAQKTGEAARGIALAEKWFAPDHPYARVLTALRAQEGPNAYPGSPMVAAHLLRDIDQIDVAELHPAEITALRDAMAHHAVGCHHLDGWQMAMSRCPPDPRRGMLLVDPSFEIKSDYDDIPDFFRKIHRKWGVGILTLWYPILVDERHRPMTAALRAQFPDASLHEVRFAPARAGHGMVGSGMFVINAPYGFDAQAAWLSDKFNSLK